MLDRRDIPDSGYSLPVSLNCNIQHCAILVGFVWYILKQPALTERGITITSVSRRDREL